MSEKLNANNELSFIHKKKKVMNCPLETQKCNEFEPYVRT